MSGLQAEESVDAVTTLGDELSEAWDKLEAGDGPIEDVEPEVESEPEESEPSEEKDESKEEESTDKVETDDTEKAEPVEAKEPELEPIEPPSEFNSEEKAAFKTLSRDAQEAVGRLSKSVRRHLTKGTEELATTRRQAEQYAQAVQATQPFTERAGISFHDWVQGMVNTQAFMDENPVAAAKALLGRLNVDPQKLFSEQPTTQVDPVAQQAMQRVAQLENLYQTQQQKAESQRQAQILEEMDSFISSTDESGGMQYPFLEYDQITGDPLHPDFFNRVVIETHLIKAKEPGKPSHEVLREAYDKASLINPIARQKATTQQQAQVSQKATEKVAKARKASKSVGSSPGQGDLVGSSDLSLEDEIRAQFES